jgi:hypothetical protein
VGTPFLKVKIQALLYSPQVPVLLAVRLAYLELV